MEHAEGYERRWWILGVLCLAAGDRARQHDPERRDPHARAGPRGVEQPAAVDRRRLHPRVRRSAADRREPRRTSTDGAGARARPRDLRLRLDGVGVRELGHDPDRHPRPHGRRRRVDHARRRCRSSRTCSRRGARSRDRHLGGRVRPRDRDRPGGRRLPARALLVGLGLPRQRPDRDRRAHRRLVDRPRTRRTRAAARSTRSARSCRSSGWSRSSTAIIEAPSHGLDRPDDPRVVRSRVVVLVGVRRVGAHTDHPMLNLEFFKNPRFTAANISITLVFFALFGSLFFLTQYLQFVLGYSPLQAGFRVAPIALDDHRGLPDHRPARQPGREQAARHRRDGSSSLGLCSSRRARSTSGYGHVLVSIMVLWHRHGARDDPGDRIDHGLAAAGEGRRRLGDERHDATGRRRARRRVLGSMFASAYTAALRPVLSGLPAPTPDRR